MLARVSQFNFWDTHTLSCIWGLVFANKTQGFLVLKATFSPLNLFFVLDSEKVQGLQGFSSPNSLTKLLQNH